MVKMTREKFLEQYNQEHHEYSIEFYMKRFNCSREQAEEYYRNGLKDVIEAAHENGEID